MIRILIADEYPVVQEGLKTLFSQVNDFEIVDVVDSTPGIIQSAQRHAPDIVLFDLCVRRHKIADAIETIRTGSPHIRFAIFTTYRGLDEVALALKDKIHGYLLKTDSSEDLIDAIRTISRGGRRLSPSLSLKISSSNNEPSLTARESEVLEEISTGKSNQEVANTLFVSEGTVKFHVNNILTKLGATDRTDAVVIGLHRGILRVPEKE